MTGHSEDSVSDDGGRAKVKNSVSLSGLKEGSMWVLKSSKGKGRKDDAKAMKVGEVKYTYKYHKTGRKKTKVIYQSYKAIVLL